MLWWVKKHKTPVKDYLLLLTIILFLLLLMNLLYRSRLCWDHWKRVIGTCSVVAWILGALKKTPGKLMFFLFQIYLPMVRSYSGTIVILSPSLQMLLYKECMLCRLQSLKEWATFNCNSAHIVLTLYPYLGMTELMLHTVIIANVRLWQLTGQSWHRPTLR